VKTPDGKQVLVTLHANPGIHNLANATAAIAVADVLVCDAADAAQALSAFQGAHRRFTHVGDVDGITVVDDYGHHPTEIRATLTAASSLDFSRIVAVFQPHRYTRTQALMDDFARAFDQADLLVVMDVFSAGEMPIPGVSGRVLAKRASELGDVEVISIDRRKDVIAYLVDALKPGDLVITQGAGDVTSIGPDLIDALRERAGEGAQA
jgi:UDP-N-acetylmuramate--alanine ligase